MSEAATYEPNMSEEAYLETEELSPVKRKFLGGVVYGKSSASTGIELPLHECDERITFPPLPSEAEE